MHAADRRDRQELQREIPVRYRVDGVARRARKAKRLRRFGAVDRKAGAGKCGRSKRAFVEPRQRVADPRAVASEHFHIGHAVMAEGHRLRCLQMCEAGHDGVGVLFGPVEKRADQTGEGGVGRLQGGAHPHAEIQRHLVVARARRVQPAGGRTDKVGKPRLDIHVNVFQRPGEREGARFDF